MALSRAALLLLAGATAAPPQPVHIKNFLFTPATLHIAAGTTVTWTNDDNAVHTIVADGAPPPFRSPPLDGGDGFSFTFAQPGTWHYHCTLHPKMQGVIVVGSGP